MAGTTVYQQCPDFVTGFNNRLLAYKECHSDGTWYAHPETGAEWSNYTTCIDVGDFEVKLAQKDEVKKTKQFFSL